MFAFVLGLSFILLTVAFRSIVIPAVAIVLNLLAVGAAYGLLVLVFQKGVGNELLGFQQIDTVEAWVPLFLFSVLFGLSMDYQVFLLSRIKERYTQTGDTAGAVAFGVGSTARLITGAALIIIAVFGGFAAGDLVMFQQMGFGVAVALLVDATIVRCVLVPASMKLLGERNWYLPAWLSWVPDVHVEGHAPSRRRPHPPPEPGPGASSLARDQHDGAHVPPARNRKETHDFPAPHHIPDSHRNAQPAPPSGHGRSPLSSGSRSAATIANLAVGAIDSVGAAIAGGLIAGAVVGTAQWLALRRFVPWLWIAATSLGMSRRPRRRRGARRLRHRPRRAHAHGRRHRPRCRRPAGAGARTTRLRRCSVVGGSQSARLGARLARQLVRDLGERRRAVHELRRQRRAPVRTR